MAPKFLWVFSQYGFTFLKKSIFVTVQLLRHVWLYATPCTVTHQALLSSTISQSLLKFMFMELLMLSNHLILYHHLLFLPSIFFTVRIFSNELALHIRWPKYWSLSFSISPSNKYSGLVPFRIGGLISLQRDAQESSPTPQFKSTNSLALSFLYSPTITSLHISTGKTIALTRWTFVSKVIPLLFKKINLFFI